MKRIPLSRGKFAIVDDCDYDYLMQWKWCYNGKYAVRVDRAKRTIPMHRIILERIGCKDFAQPDHINRSKLDNSRCNLRGVTHSQSNCNRGKLKNNTSGYIGVHWRKQVRKWVASIRVNGKLIHLGYYNDLKEAARAYDEAALKYRGKFAVLNEV